MLTIDKALEALDSMAFSAMRLCIFSSENSPDETSLALVDTLVADGHSTGGLESEIRLPAGNKVWMHCNYRDVRGLQYLSRESKHTRQAIEVRVVLYCLTLAQRS